MSSSSSQAVMAALVSTPRQIPPEVVAMIIDWLADRQALGACAVVSRLWKTFPRPKLWGAPLRAFYPAETFLRILRAYQWQLNRLATRRMPRCFTLPDSASFISKLKFQVGGGNLALFSEMLPRMQPSLKHLILIVSCSYQPLLKLIVDNCPKNVVRLHLDWFPDTRVPAEERNDRQNALPIEVDGIELRRFFSQLIEVCWIGSPGVTDLALSSAHGNLRGARLPECMSENKVGQFITSCSSTLVVANFTNVSISDENLLLLGRTCPRLRAFFSDEMEEVSDEVFETFLTMTSSNTTIMGRKTLGEQLAELANAAPADFDPEQIADGGFGKHSLGDDNEEGGLSDHEQEGREHYVSVGRSKLRGRNFVDLDDPKYAGKRVSRKQMEELEDDSGEDEDGVEDDDDEEEEADDSEGDQAEFDGLEQGDSDDDEAEDMSDLEDFDANGVSTGDFDEEDDRDEQDEDEDDDDDEEDDDEEESAMAHQSASLNQELAELEKEEKKLAKSMSQSAQNDIEKGRHVRNQMAVFEQMLDLRIHLQRVLSIANQFPKYQVHSAFMATDDEADDENQIIDTVNLASTELCTLVQDLISLRMSLLEKHDTLKSDLHSKLSERLKTPKRKRHESVEGENGDDESQAEGAQKRARHMVEDYWADVSALDDAFSSYRDQTIEKWNAKIQMASAGAFGLQKKFKAINQSVLTQVKNVLSDRERLLKRTRLNRSDLRSLGEPREQGQSSTDESQQPQQESETSAQQNFNKLDSEIYDDGDFYQMLLKEFIEARISDTDDPIALGIKNVQLRLLQQEQKKKRKANVDTKASKGRKIRYHVLEKLQNFMAPQPAGTWHEEMAEELFKGLFGVFSGDAAAAESSVADGKEGGDANGIKPTMDGFKIFN
ncbi:hypothetical protein HK102_002967 [Quaeritorhiza haematococci]|nr:hypothetical protein HK102_002967 [Quaeritorhiza haematococci]